MKLSRAGEGILSGGDLDELVPGAAEQAALAQGAGVEDKGARTQVGFDLGNGGSHAVGLKYVSLHESNSRVCWVSRAGRSIGFWGKEKLARV
ncbi:hypothetical protein ES705_47786 [subsurface metagenome]